MVVEDIVPRNHDRLVAGFGIASVTLLAAALRWAHHWNPVADLIVLGWAVSTLGAVVVGIRMVRRGESSRLVRIGLAFGLVSVASLVIAGIAFAAGGDPAGSCGGG